MNTIEILFDSGNFMNICHFNCLPQYMLSSGRGYDNYGLILSAATLVPLQGFWNNIVYIRTRYLGSMMSYVGSTSRRVSSYLQRGSSYFQRSSNPDITEQSALESIQQSVAHDQFQVIQFNRSSLERNLFDERDNVNTLNKEEEQANPLETTPKMVHFVENPVIRTFFEEDDDTNTPNENEVDGTILEKN